MNRGSHARGGTNSTVSLPPDVEADSGASPDADDASPEDGAASLRALLQQEVHPRGPWPSGRAYLPNLVRWRDRLLSAERGASESPAAAAATARRETTTTTTPRRVTTESPARTGPAAPGAPGAGGNDDGPARPPFIRNRDARRGAVHVPKLVGRGGAPCRSEAESEAPFSSAARPDRDPALLLEWRARMAEWYFDFVDQVKLDPNTALAALSYLDVYSMRVCFPEHFSRITEEENDEDTSLAPSPPKKRKPNDHQDDYLWEYVEQQQREKSFWEEAVRGLDSGQYRLATVASMYLACKICHSTTMYMYSTSDWSRIFKSQFSPDEIEAMELSVLDAVGFRVHPPTALRFVQEIAPLLLVSNDAADRGFALDARPWAPRDAVDHGIAARAGFLARLAACGDGNGHAPVLVYALPSKIALAAIVAASNGVFFDASGADGRDKLLVRQHAFLERLVGFQDVPYDEEARTIQRCLIDLARLGDRIHDASREVSPSPATVADSTLDPNKDLATAAYAADCKENLTGRPRKDPGGNTRPAAASSRAVLRDNCAAGRSTGTGPPRKRTRICPGGSRHRMWERADRCAAAAAAARRSYESFAIEML